MTDAIPSQVQVRASTANLAKGRARRAEPVNCKEKFPAVKSSLSRQIISVVREKEKTSRMLMLPLPAQVVHVVPSVYHIRGEGPAPPPMRIVFCVCPWGDGAVKPFERL